MGIRNDCSTNGRTLKEAVAPVEERIDLVHDGVRRFIPSQKAVDVLHFLPPQGEDQCLPL